MVRAKGSRVKESLLANFQPRLPRRRRLAKSDKFFVSAGNHMTKTHPSFPTTPARKPASVAFDRKSVKNEILLGLPLEERDTLFAKLELVDLPVQDVLNEMGESIEHCYFVNSGLASVLNVMRDGKSVEVGLSGKEGFVGLPLVVGLRTSSTRTVMQIAGSAFRMDAASLVQELGKRPQLEKRLNRYSQELGLQTTQVAACNRLHEVHQRLARWLLMSQDRIEGDVVPLTQEFLAHMLGTRRASVTVAAGILQKRRAIKYSRGSVAVLDRKKLEAASCECYQAIVRQSQAWQDEKR
jgi:CRP-like cAMP-binding protein